MSALDVIDRLSNTNLIYSNLKYCLVDEYKKPFSINGNLAKPNDVNDFVNFEDLFQCSNVSSFAGIGISIQASNVCAIDVDKCFSEPNDINSADNRAKYFIELFRDKAYIEFSFSGTGMRILFYHDIIEDYSSKYYIKNEIYKLEYYQPSKSYRYVTLTGRTISNVNIEDRIDVSSELEQCLNKYMKRAIRQSYEVHTQSCETRSYEELMKIVKRHYLKNSNFQNLWFNDAPGSGKDESERDYHLVAFLFENVTQDKTLLKQIFESSNFFKTKDSHHMYKWTAQEGRYFNYLYETVKRRTS